MSMSSQLSTRPLAQAPAPASRMAGRKNFMTVAGAGDIDVIALEVGMIGMSDMPGEGSCGERRLYTSSHDRVWN